MKKSTIFLGVALAITLAACNNSSTGNEQTNANADTSAFHALDTTTLAAGTVFYQCEMHPEITSDKPGTCPTCGMDLVKMEKH